MGGKPRPARQMKEFREDIDSNGLLDLGWINQKFTWSNRHNNDTFMKERLDRVVANISWINVFSSFGVEVLIIGQSDHNPILLTTTERYELKPRNQRQFHYEAKWAKEDDGEQPIFYELEASSGAGPLLGISFM